MILLWVLGGSRQSSMVVRGIFPRYITSVLLNMAAYQFIQMFKASAFIADLSLGDWRQPDIVVMVKSTRFCMVRGEILVCTARFFGALLGLLPGDVSAATGSMWSSPSFRWLVELCWSPWPTEASRELRWISTVVYGAPNDTGLDSYSRVLDFWFMVVKNVEAILGGDWRQPDIVVMVKSTRFCMVRGEI
ncbi:hypothetical protein F2Q69_00053447 [Brassica cretica]|uniref:Uncharacterized protein n=1 Tax=Brassica cretica TaxID=69181 RepID=A0A8S9MUW4_BRACR|nr:hypothetical protein F2Q69_00053447 [Brassica cretica]